MPEVPDTITDSDTESASASWSKFKPTISPDEWSAMNPQDMHVVLKANVNLLFPVALTLL